MSRIEVVVAVAAAAVLAGLVVLEPAILNAPFQSGRAVAFTFGGLAVGLLGFVVMVVARVPVVVRLVLLGVPFVVVNNWLLSPYFRDEVVQEDFVVSIADATPGDPDGSSDEDESEGEPPPAAQPTAPVLRGAGKFVGLAGYRAAGDAGIFAQPDGSLVLRLESLAVQNGPDLELYLVPGADRRSPGVDGSIHLGALRGNVGSLTYELEAGTELPAGDWTVLIWCEAFTVEFGAATLTLA